MMQSTWQWQMAQSRQKDLIDEAARNRRLRPADGAAAAAPRGLRRSAALLLRHWADRLEPGAPPQLGILRAVAHHELDVEHALRLLGTASAQSVSR